MERDGKKSLVQTAGEGPPMAAFPSKLVQQQVVSEVDDDDEEPSGCPATEDQPTPAQPSDADNVLANKPAQEDDGRFQPGDHVYQWCSVLGIPGIFQHHGIVIHVEDIGGGGSCHKNNSEGAEGGDQLLTIADFSNLLLKNTRSRSHNDDEEEETVAEEFYEANETEVQPHEEEEEEEEGTQQQQQQQSQPAQSGSLTTGTLFRSGSAGVDSNSSQISKHGSLRVYKTTSSKNCKWHKVQYEDHWFHTHLWKRSGTCTPIKSDPPEMVLKRVHFLLAQSLYNNNPQDDDDNDTTTTSILPKFHSIFANCECVAVWCKTGTWSTLQAASFLGHAAVGQVKATATIGGIAAAQTVTVPAAGVWGWLGYSTTVPLMSVNPVILPALVTYGAVTIGGPAICLAVAKKRWKETTAKLNEALEAESMQLALVT